MKTSKKLVYFIAVMCFMAILFSNVTTDLVSAADDYRYESATFKYKDVKFTISAREKSNR